MDVRDVDGNDVTISVILDDPIIRLVSDALQHPGVVSDAGFRAPHAFVRQLHDVRGRA